MARIRLSQNELSRPLDSTPSYLPTAISRRHALSNTKNSRPFILSAHGQAYTQPPNLPRLPGQVGFLGDPVLKPRRGKKSRLPTVVENPVDQDYDAGPFLHPPVPLEPPRSKNTNKKLLQWKRWQESTLPTLIQPYLQLLADSESLSKLTGVTFPQCGCGHAQKLTPIAVSFTNLQSISLQSCKCLPTVAEQLVARGFFPCAPLVPSLVVDIRLLDFASKVFLHMPPNNTAWCKAMEDFLSSLGFGLKREDNLRRRFENALRWFSTLKHVTSRHISRRIDSVRSVLITPNITLSPSQLSSTQSDYIIPQAHCLSPEMNHPTELGHRPQQSSDNSNSPQPVSHIPRLTRQKGIEKPIVLVSQVTPSIPPTASPIPPSRIPRRRSGVVDANSGPPQPSVSATALSPSTISNSVVTARENPIGNGTQLPIRNQCDVTSNSGGDAAPFPITTQSTPTPVPQSTSANRKRTRSKSPSTEDCSQYPFPQPEARTRPSEYLRRRCPLCFGGEYPSKASLKPDAIVCIDACFTQKRNKAARDPERVHPDTVFLSETDIQRMQSYVETVRPPKDIVPKSKRQRKPPTSTQEDEPEDTFEDGLSVPISVLNGCEASFKAADEGREKASTQYFDDTGLMAMLCRHDRVLWVANVRSAGEKQYYALALLETLFQHLPILFIIGLLYDIGCQLHRSCLKWGYLKPYLDRILFGISVFHAFGHQWPCQLVYHPRKCVGFGLSDGEGCERFWHSISKLIPMLRVSGYHQRLYTLDVQVQHLDSTNLKRLGTWLARRTQHCRQKRIAAEEGLAECGVQVKDLRREWAAQVHAQTRPSPRRSKDNGKTAVEEVIRLRTAYEVQKKRTLEIEQQLTNVGADGYLHALASIDIRDARLSLKRIEGQLRTKEGSLGVNQKVELSKLINDPYIALRMNAFALKTRLRDRLRSRKFELNPVERMARKFSHNTQKLHSQMDSSVQRRDPTIQRIARAYNKLCDEMSKLVAQKKAPAGSVAPSKVSMEGLFSLDVDDAIWQDVGLTDDPAPQAQGEAALPPQDEPRPRAPPGWLSDDRVRQGIRAMLELDRCLEEEARLVHERRSMQVWFHEEWRAINKSLNGADTTDILYALEKRKNNLCLLQVLWFDKAGQLSSEQGTLSPLPEWGPSTAEIINARSKYYTASIQHESEKLGPQYKYDSEVEDDDNDSELDGEDYDEFMSVMDIVSSVYPDNEEDSDWEPLT